MHALSIEDDSAVTSPTPIASTGTNKRSHLRLYLAIAVALAAVALLVGLLAGLLTRHSSSSSSSTYRAVAVQYMAIANSTNATQLLTANLASYSAILSSLSAQQPDIVAFPEGGLGYFEADQLSSTNATVTRQALLPFCATLSLAVPVSSTDAANPCLSPSSAPSPANQLETLSCLARQYQTTLVVNLCQIEVCTPGTPASAFSSPFGFARTACPADGHYYWSSNVVFASDGHVAAVYPKAHVFDTLSFDVPNPVAVSWLDERTGVTFGTFTSFDIEFTQPAQSLLLAGVQHYVMDLVWLTNQPPQLTIVMIQQAWAERWGVNLIAANSLSQVGIGGGVYSSGAIANYLFDPTLSAQAGEWRLVVQDLPKQLPPSPRPLTVPTAITTGGLIAATNSASTPCSISAIGMDGNCTFLSSTTTSPQLLAASHGDVRCLASVTLSSPSADASQYALFAAQYAYNHADTPSSLYLENCFLVRCVQLSASPTDPAYQCNDVSYAATLAVAAATVQAAFNCSRFAATEADGGVGEDGSGPAGTVLPMLAVNGAQTVGVSAGVSYGYMGKLSDGGCWWQMATSGSSGLSGPLFSMGFYGVDGQADYTVQ